MDIDRHPMLMAKMILAFCYMKEIGKNMIQDVNLSTTDTDALIHSVNLLCIRKTARSGKVKIVKTQVTDGSVAVGLPTVYEYDIILLGHKDLIPEGNLQFPFIHKEQENGFPIGVGYPVSDVAMEDTDMLNTK